MENINNYFINITPDFHEKSSKAYLYQIDSINKALIEINENVIIKPIIPKLSITDLENIFHFFDMKVPINKLTSVTKLFDNHFNILEIVITDYDFKVSYNYEDKLSIEFLKLKYLYKSIENMIFICDNLCVDENLLNNYEYVRFKFIQDVYINYFEKITRLLNKLHKNKDKYKEKNYIQNKLDQLNYLSDIGLDRKEFSYFKIINILINDLSKYLLKYFDYFYELFTINNKSIQSHIHPSFKIVIEFM